MVQGTKLEIGKMFNKIKNLKIVKELKITVDRTKKVDYSIL